MRLPVLCHCKLFCVNKSCQLVYVLRRNRDTVNQLFFIHACRSFFEVLVSLLYCHLSDYRELLKRCSGSVSGFDQLRSSTVEHR